MQKELFCYSVTIDGQQCSGTDVPNAHRSAKRVRIDSSPRYQERADRVVTSSQPVHFGEATISSEAATPPKECFTQPSRFDELIIGTQLPCTPGASQPPFQRLVMRMTRFYTRFAADAVWAKLTRTLEKLGYDLKAAKDLVSLTAVSYTHLTLPTKA